MPPWIFPKWAVLSFLWICSSEGCASIINRLYHRGHVRRKKDKFYVLFGIFCIIIFNQIYRWYPNTASNVVMLNQNVTTYESNEALIKPDVPTRFESISNNFQIYWNVPTFMCHKYGLYFPQVLRKFGIIQNDKDKFRGDKIAILYDPGDFPAILKDSKDNYVRRNGGVPQEGNLTLHLEHFRHHLAEQIPSGNFSGLGIIDFESWRPIYRQNWASLQIYRDLSYEIERKRHPFYPPKILQQDASDRFEKFGRIFMQRTLELAQRLRPKAEWGYYAYPYCFNWSPNQQSPQCSPKVVDENDGMTWLFGTAKVLFPSVYLQRKLTPSQRVGLVRGRVQEAVRLAKNFHNKKPAKVFVYYWYKYQDQRDSYIDKRDIVGTIKEVVKRGADGLVLWGSSNDLDSQDKCETFREYLFHTLGPAIVQLQEQLNSAGNVF